MSFILATDYIATKVMEVVSETDPEVIVIEETSKGRASQTQKVIEFLHCELNRRLYDKYKERVANGTYPVYYVRNSEWRKTLSIGLTKEQKKNNQKVSKANKSDNPREMKEKLGVSGRITKKHLSVQYVNTKFGTNYKLAQNDLADAVCLGESFIKGAKAFDGQLG